MNAAAQNRTSNPDTDILNVSGNLTGLSAKEVLPPAEYKALVKEFQKSRMAVIDSPNPVAGVLDRLAQHEKRAAEAVESINKKYADLQETLKNLHETERQTYILPEQLRAIDQRLANLEKYQDREEQQPTEIAVLETKVNWLLGGVAFMLSLVMGTIVRSGMRRVFPSNRVR